MAFNNSTHVFFTLGFLLLMASGGVEALYWFCYIPSGSFHGPCMSNGHCLDACKREYYKGDKSKPFTGGECSLSGSIFPRCICSIFCGPPLAEHDDPETHRHRHHPPPPPPSEGPEPSLPPHQAPPPHHHRPPPPFRRPRTVAAAATSPSASAAGTKPPAQGDE